MFWILLACTGSKNMDSASEEPIAEIEAYDWSADWRALTEGVTAVNSGESLPSSYTVFGDRAFPVIWDEDYRPFVVATSVGDGRAVFFGHEGMTGGLANQDDGYNRLLRNAVQWSASGEDRALTIGLLGDYADAAAILEEEGHTVQAAELSNLDEDVLILSAYESRDTLTRERLEEYIRGGGGLMVTGHAWWWAYSNPDLNVVESYESGWMAELMGISWTPYSHVNAWEDTVSAEPPSDMQHAERALDAFMAHFDGQRSLSLEEQNVGLATLDLAIGTLPLSFSEFFNDARSYSEQVGPVVPTLEAPLVPAEQPAQALSARLEAKFALEDAPERVLAHPAAEELWGPFDSSTEAVTLELDLSYAGRDSAYIYSGAGAALWVHTGYSALPGQAITLSVPQSVVDSGLQLAIGVHTDTLWHKEEQSRFPELVRVDAVNSSEMTVASGFGGPIVLRVPAGLSLGSTSVTLNGVQAAPHYIHGSSDWETELSKPGRWATLQTSDVVLSLPSDSLSQVADPVALMDFWQSVADTAADLDGTERDRPRAEQYVFDRQISAGWMHSGYPLMAHLESVESALSLESLTTVGDWGFFHELGHNHQHVDWILPGTTESTCNLWSVYLMEKLVSIETAGHPALTPEERSTRMQNYLANGANIGDWSVWVALETYLQLQEAFGWEFYTEIFTRYRALSESQRPGTDADRFDRWAQLSSEISGVNLVPFYQAWGWTLSQSVIDELSSLPAWDANPMAN